MFGDGLLSVLEQSRKSTISSSTTLIQNLREMLVQQEDRGSGIMA